MKKILILLSILFTIYCDCSHVSATVFPLITQKTDTGITVSMSGLPVNDANSYTLIDGTSPIIVDNKPFTKKASNGLVEWFIPTASVKSSGTYAFSVIQFISLAGIETPVPVSETKLLSVSSASLDPIVQNFSIKPSGDRSVTVSGKIDTSIYASPNLLSIEFQWSQTKSDTGEPTAARQLISGKGGQPQIASDGSYTIVVSGLTPTTTYYFKQIVSVVNTVAPLETTTGTFTTEKGYLAPGTVGEQLDFNSRSYHLLAPFPGLSVLMDPDLCLEKKIKKEIPQDAICDVNGFLDFVFKLMIGLAAVVLVLRLMYEGYRYVVTDVPFLKANAKSGFFSSLLGLLLALSAYLILNTINPKLVDNTITIDSVNVGIDDVYDRADDPLFMARLDSVSIAGITGNINDETFLVYLAHQQGAGGANAILAAAKNNTPPSGKIITNMSTNFNTKDAQRTINTSTLTPINFLNYWAIKVAAFKKNPSANIPESINTQLAKVSQETGISLATLQVICRIESSCNGQKAIENVNSYGYAGLYQLSNAIYMKSKKPGVWEKFKKADGVLLDAYHNAYAAAGYMKSNLSLLTR